MPDNRLDMLPPAQLSASETSLFIDKKNFDVLVDDGPAAYANHDRVYSTNGVKAMKLSHKLNARSATPLWLFALGLVLSVTGAGLWCHAMTSTSATQASQSFAVTAVLLGVIAVVYAAHELLQRRR
ncbi:hypothetical protein [Paraburkholderia sp. Ac-20340]|uniref:hypothetical protein n=1 Tax=Paraburkholderia sp. Ac-20340 TaxID=2703888 RepID=UPI001F11E250|nr:hypothetical protein [Paraburkholderia sp. Ac-20340]